LTHGLARSLNGTTIKLYDARELDKLEFFHIKLERHNVIYAEGAPCETVIDVNEKAVNFVEYLRHYGPPATQEAPCAAIAQLQRRPKRNKVEFPQCDLTLD
jgi:hypothetical protein